MPKLDIVMRLDGLFAVRQFGREVDAADALLDEGADAVRVERTEVVRRHGLARVGLELRQRQRAREARILARAVDAHADAAAPTSHLRAAAEGGLAEVAVGAVVVGGLVVDRRVERRRRRSCATADARTSCEWNWPASALTEPRPPSLPGRLVTIWITPAVAPSPYSTALPPRTISMRSTVSIGMVDSTGLASSFSLMRTPSSMTTMFWPLLAPKPRRSSEKSGLESRLWRPNTPPILRIAWLTSPRRRGGSRRRVMTVAPIGASFRDAGESASR